MRTRAILQILFSSAVAATVSAQSLGTFGQTSQLTTVRTSHTATLLPNGKVLIAGGWATLSGWPAWSSAELYDPSAHSFALTGAMAAPRYGHTATLLPDGRVLIAGGSSVVNGSSSLASAELYDPSTGIFTAAGDMTTARAHHTATLLNSGKVLITGGLVYGAGGNEIDLASAELYDPVTGIFTAVGSMAAIRSYHVAVLLSNGKVLIQGGSNPEELYDPASGSFTLAGSSANAECPSAAASLPNGFVITTFNWCGDFSNDADLYDASTGTFAPAPPMTTMRRFVTATLLPEGMVLIDGESDQPYVAGGTSELYDPLAGTFTATVGMFPQSDQGHTATLLPDGTVLLAGGWICCGYSVANAEIYSPAVLTRSPVLYSASSGSQGAIWNATTGQIASSQNPAAAGEILAMYTTGLMEGGVIPPQVAIGARLAEIVFFGDAPGYPGYFQVNFRVPTGVTPGPAIPIRLTYLNRPSNEVSIGVR